MSVTPSISAKSGLIFYATFAGGQSWIDRSGEEQVAEVLTSANYLASDWVPVGSAVTMEFSVGGVISAGMGSASVIIEARMQDDAQNPTLAPKQAVIGTVRGDAASSAPASSQTITRANLVGQNVDEGGGAAVEVIDVRLMTSDMRQAALVRAIVKATAPPENGDYIRISVAGA